MRNLIECYESDDLKIEVTRYSPAFQGTAFVTIRLSDGQNVSYVRMSESQARDLLGTLANELVMYADAEVVTPPAETTYTATDEGVAALSRLVCDTCGEGVAPRECSLGLDWSHVDEDGDFTTWACDPINTDGEQEYFASVGGSVHCADYTDEPRVVDLINTDATPKPPFKVGDWVSAPFSNYEVRVDGDLIDIGNGWGQFYSSLFRSKGDRDREFSNRTNESHCFDESSEHHFTKVEATSDVA